MVQLLLKRAGVRWICFILKLVERFQFFLLEAFLCIFFLDGLDWGTPDSIEGSTSEVREFYLILFF